MEDCHVSHWAGPYGGVLADHSCQGIVLADRHLTITHANARAVELLGARCRADLVGLPLHSGQEGSGVNLEGPAAAAKTEPQSGRYTVSSEFGAELPADVRVVPLSEHDGEQGYLILITDLTRQVDLERTVLQSEKLEAMENIVAGIAHELNNPMTAILGYAELLLASEKDPKRKQRVALIAEEADRCGKIIASMLTYTRTYGKTLETASVNAVLDDVMSLQAYQLEVDGIRSHRHYDPSIPDCPLLTSGLRRLFLNIIHNAHQALLEVPREKRNLWAVTELCEDTISIQISDDGPGIPKPIRHKIFDPFFTTRPLGDGMGLGLSVAFGVVHEHGGKIWVDPRTGGGTVVCIELPLRFEAP